MKQFILFVILLLVSACGLASTSKAVPTSTFKPTMYAIIKPPKSITIYVDAPQGDGCTRLVKTKPAFVEYKNLQLGQTVYETSLGRETLNCTGQKDHNGVLMPNETLYRVVPPEYYDKLIELNETFWLPESAIKKVE
jgi:hypothetical protein